MTRWEKKANMANGTRFSRRVLARTIAAKLVAEPSHQSHWLRVLAAHLVDQNRADEADLIIHDIEQELYEQAGQLTVHVTSARSLTDSTRQSLKKMLKDQTDAKQVVLTEKVDPGLLGGLIARSAHAELDASVRTKLNQLASIT
jgi:ATP synthase F1 delta subunit